MCLLQEVFSNGFEIFGFFVHWYGVIIAFGMLMGVLLAVWNFKRRGLNPDMVLDIALICIPSAIVGARLYYCIFYENHYTFWQLFEIWNGGMAIYGGVIGGAIGLIIYCCVKKVNFFEFADCVAPSLILGQAIGRWGNYTNCEAYGKLITDTNMQFFPFGVQIPYNNFTNEALQAYQSAGLTGNSAWFMATFFYESMWNLLVCITLLILIRKINVKGIVMCAYFVLYGVGRFFIEQLRMDSLYFLGLRVSQWLSLILVVSFTILAIILINKDKRKHKEQNDANGDFDTEQDFLNCTGQNYSQIENTSQDIDIDTD